MPHGCRTGTKTWLCPKCGCYYKPIESSDPCPECGLSGSEHEAYIERARAESPLLADLEQMLPHLEESLVDARFGGRGAEPAPGLRGGGEAAALVPTGSACLEVDYDLVEAALVRFIR